MIEITRQDAVTLGFGAMLSDSDVLNAPMHAAQRRNGHSSERTAWHKWMRRRKI